MTDPAPSLTGAELDRAISDAARLLIATVRKRPWNQQAVDDAQREYDALVALKNSGV